MKRFLLISYVWPPAGGGGVQRPVKFAKYIHQFGWQPVVVTAKNPSAPSRDPSLEADLPPGLPVHRLATVEPAAPAGGGGSGAAGGVKAALKRAALRLLFPDRHVLWLATALPGALRAAKRHAVDAVMVTAPPFSSFYLGARVARKLGLPLVLDFRDEWSGYYAEGFNPGQADHKRQQRVEKAEARLVGQAARVIGASRAYGKRFLRLYGGDPAKYAWIPNGYDHQDFEGLESLAPEASAGRPLRLLYAGTIFEVTSLDMLWRAMAELSEAERGRLEVRICGRAAPGQVLDPGLAGLTVVVSGYLEHREVVRRMASADALLLTLADLPGSQRVIPGKLFEYLAARRPILALVPRGETAGLVDVCKAGRVITPSNHEGLVELLRAWPDDPPPAPGPPPEVFSRRYLAGRLAEVLDQAVSTGEAR